MPPVIAALGMLLLAVPMGTLASPLSLDSIATAKQRVELTLGVMSRCPDAVFAEAAFDRVIPRVLDELSLRFTYIGDEDEEEDTGVRCKHGPQECWGNIHQLCVQHALRPSRAGRDFNLSPSAAQRKVWDFIQCQDYDGIRNIGSEALAQQCLRTIKGPEWEKDGIVDCVRGPLGKQLLRDSVRDSRRRGIEKSATIQLEGEGTICVRDGGEWKDCPGGHETADFVRQIEDAWRRKGFSE
ncbi:unnamed protein product [Jaminaea pallidilutea]